MPHFQSFDASGLDPSLMPHLVPAGTYLAEVVESEWRPVRSGNGRYLQLAFRVREGEFRDRVVWARLHLEGGSATTRRIARAELDALCRAAGVPEPRQIEEIHGRPLRIAVGVRRRGDSPADLANVVRGYAAAGSR